jgi:predicted PurR-regulated permease PerM
MEALRFQERTIRYRWTMPPEGSASLFGGVISRREARLLFWLVVLALVGVTLFLWSGPLSVLASPAIILFVAWLLSYVLEPPVTWLQRHLPFKGRGAAVAITYLVTAVVAFVVISSAAVAIIQAATSFVANLPQILAQVQTTLQPLVDFLGISLPSGDTVVTAVQQFLAENAAHLADAAQAAVRNAIVLVGSLITAVIISVGLAMGQVSLLGWLRRFLPSSTYRDLTELERAIAVSFGGFVRGRLLIGAIYGAVVGIGALLLGIPYSPLIAVIAGLIVFIPWIGPLIGWIVLPAFASLLEPSAVFPAFVISALGAIAIQLVVTQFVMAGAVNMTPVAVFVVVILGTSVAGIIGAVFAIPTAAAILSVTDYLRQRDVLLRAAEPASTSTEPIPEPTVEEVAPSPTV